MLVVTKVYDDKSADLFDIVSYETRRYTFNKIEQLNKHVIGTIVYNNELLSIKSMRVTSFPTEKEAFEYKKENHGEILFLHDYWWVLVEENTIIHVDYYVYTQIGDEVTYVSESGYTPYIQGAKRFGEVDAIKISRSMTKCSKTGKYWKVKRVVKNERY